MRQQKIPYQISGGQSFFDKAEIKDLLAWLRLLVNEDDDPAFIRAITTPKRGVGATTLEKLGNYAGERKCSLFAAVQESGLHSRLAEAQLAPLTQFTDFIGRIRQRAEHEPAGKVITELVAAIDYEGWLFASDEPRPAETKWKNVLELIDWLGSKGERDAKNLLELTQTIALITLLEGKDEGEVDAVRLSTLHAAKGLEYGHVFLVGCEEGTLPHQSSIDAEQVEEERRLMYVGITRAQRSLTISYCERRKAGREVRTCDPSRFIDEMGAEGIRRNDRKSAEPVTKEDARARIANLRAMLGNKPGTIG